jgi:translation initiation factor IF-3
MDVKRRQVRKFLEAGNKVKITARFKGREMARKELGPPVLMRFLEPLADISQIEQEPSMAGRDMSIVVASTAKAAIVEPSTTKEDSDAKAEKQ